MALAQQICNFPADNPFKAATFGGEKTLGEILEGTGEAPVGDR